MNLPNAIILAASLKQLTELCFNEYRTYEFVDFDPDWDLEPEQNPTINPERYLRSNLRKATIRVILN